LRFDPYPYIGPPYEVPIPFSIRPYRRSPVPRPVTYHMAVKCGRYSLIEALIRRIFEI